ERDAAGRRRRGGAGSEPAELDPGRDADAHVPALLTELFLLLSQLLIASQLESFVEALVIVARVIRELELARVREFLDEVLAPHLDRIHPDRGRDQVDSSLHHMGGLGPPGAAIRI